VQVPYRNVFGENFEETRRRVPDIRRAQQVLGFRAEVPLEEGLQKTVAWFRQAWPKESLAAGDQQVAGFFDLENPGR
jgi:UDP-glucose 4-epimerase